MISFRKLIEEEFGSDKRTYNKISTLITKYQFDKNLEALEQKINEEHFKNKNAVNFKALASDVLTAINSKLSIIPKTEKPILENVLSKVGQKILYEVLRTHPNPETFINAVTQGLDESVKTNNWKKEELVAKLGFDLNSQKPKVAPKTDIKSIGFEIATVNERKTEGIIADYFFDRDVIKSKKEFKKVFTVSAIPHGIKINKEKLHLAMVLIKTLCIKKVLKCKGTKGYFDILNYHFTDLDRKSLIKGLPKHTYSELIKKTSKQLQYQGMADNLIQEILRPCTDL